MKKGPVFDSKCMYKYCCCAAELGHKASFSLQPGPINRQTHRLQHVQHDVVENSTRSRVVGLTQG